MFALHVQVSMGDYPAMSLTAFGDKSAVSGVVRVTVSNEEHLISATFNHTASAPDNHNPTSNPSCN